MEIIRYTAEGSDLFAFSFLPNEIATQGIQGSNLASVGIRLFVSFLPNEITTPGIQGSNLGQTFPCSLLHAPCSTGIQGSYKR